MALAFPLALASFLDLLPVASCDFDLGEAMQLDETGGGEQLRSDLGSRLWTGRYTMTPMTFDESTAAQALIDVVRASGGAFLATDLRQRGPRTDRDGAGLAGYAPYVSATQSAGREITLSALPPGYSLLPGDMLSFLYDVSGPAVRQALHRVVTVGFASGGGTTGWIEVNPAIRAGMPASVPVTLFRPFCKAVIVPQSFDPGSWRDRLVSGMSFRFVQTLVR